MSELSHTVSLRFGPKHSWCHNVTVDLLVIDCVSPFIEFSDLCKSSKICTKELEKCLLWKHEYQNLITQNPHKKTRNTDTLTHWHTHITPGLERQEDPGAHWPDCPVESASCRASERPCLKEYGGDQLRKAPSISLWPSHTHAYLCAQVPAHRCAHTGTHTNTTKEIHRKRKAVCRLWKRTNGLWLKPECYVSVGVFYEHVLQHTEGDPLYFSLKFH